MGIPKEKISNLFADFSNLQEHRQMNPTGRGLGLSICKSLVEKMGGKITIDSAEGHGSKFNIVFELICHP